MRKNILAIAVFTFLLVSCNKNASGGNKGIIPTDGTTTVTTEIEASEPTTVEENTINTENTEPVKTEVIKPVRIEVAKPVEIEVTKPVESNQNERVNIEGEAK